MRNTIQKVKIDMANEVIDAGRFDMQTTMEERKITLESLLQVLAAGRLSALLSRSSSRCQVQAPG